ncbi:MAG: CoA transferase [Propionibacteriales bacterium]|nr:CoA transferase [Propionibacteriales bacterium]
MTTSSSVDLSGLRILAVTQYGAGPYAMQHLADLGADVIKIESPDGGDYARSLPPYTNEDGSDSLFFQALNRGVRSVTLDLGCAEGQRVLHALASRTDAVFVNLRADVGKRLGLDYDALREANPRIVSCWLTGYGRRGSRSDAAGFDYMVQAESGIMSLSGDPDRLPAKAGVSIIDFATGIAGAFAVAAGLLTAHRRGTGGDVDVSLQDTAASLLNYVATWHLTGGYVPERLASSAHPSLVPSQLFTCSDAPIVVMVNKEKFWPRLSAAVGHPEWEDQPDRATFDDRLAHREQVQRDLEAVFRTDTAQNWLARLAEFGVPSGPVRTVAEAFADPEYLHRTVSYEHPDFGVVRSPGFLVNAEEERAVTPAPPLGAQTEEVLSSVAGFSADEIELLRRQKVV